MKGIVMATSLATNENARMRNLIEQWNISAVMLFICIKLLLFFYKIMPARRKDGWRKTTEVYHRTEQAKYISSLLNLAIDCSPSSNAQEWIIERLYSAFKNTPEAHYALRWTRNAAIRTPHRYIDFAEARFSSAGELTHVAFYPDKDYSVAPHVDLDTAQELQETLITAYNQTRRLPDIKRPRALYKKLIKRNTKNETSAYLERMLRATWISFTQEATRMEDRLAPHFFTHQKHPGFGVVNIHCKYSSSCQWADLWLQVSHIAMDGGPAGKLQNRIRKAFGMHDPNFDFHKARAYSSESILYKKPDKEVYYGCKSIDFDGVMSARRILLKKYGTDLEGNISPVSLLIWGLAHHSQFKGEKFNAPVNIAASGSMEPTVGFVLIKPEVFMDNNSEKDALLSYLRAFNHQVQQIRNRRGENYLFLQSTTMATPWMNGLVLRLLPSGLRAFAGSTCVTVLRGVEYPIPPLSDNIESMIGVSLPMSNEHKCGCVGTAAFTDTSQQMLSAVKDVAENFHRYMKADGN